jgi:hypothetical protein
LKTEETEYRFKSAHQKRGQNFNANMIKIFFENKKELKYFRTTEEFV